MLPTDLSERSTGQAYSTVNSVNLVENTKIDIFQRVRYI